MEHNQSKQLLLERHSPTATTGLYDVFVNDIEVYFNRAYTFGGGGSNGEVDFEAITFPNTIGLDDDFSIATIPEPRAALPGGLGMLALLRRRRTKTFLGVNGFSPNRLRGC